MPTLLQAARRPNAPCDMIERTASVSVCAFGPRRAHFAGSVALVGDSHAAHWRAALADVVAARRWRGLSITRTGCRLSAATPPLEGRSLSRCLQWNREVPRWLASHPEVSTVFVAQHSGSKGVRPGQREFADQVAGYRKAWSALPGSVRHVVVPRDTPTMPGTTPTCVEQAMSDGRDAATACAAARSVALPPDPAVAAAGGEHGNRVRAVELTRFLCDDRRCPAVIGGALVYKDVST